MQYLLYMLLFMLCVFANLNIKQRLLYDEVTKAYIYFYARLLVCNAKTLIHLQSITPLHTNTTKHTL